MHASNIPLVCYENLKYSHMVLDHFRIIVVYDESDIPAWTGTISEYSCNFVINFKIILTWAGTISEFR